MKVPGFFLLISDCRMVQIVKIGRWALTLVLLLILVITGFFVLDKYIFHPNIKGISPVDLKHIAYYLIIPILVMILLARFLERVLPQKS